MGVAFQDLYPDQYAHCYGCGRFNETGLHVKSYWAPDDPDVAICHYTPDASYSGGWPTVMYGGLIAALIDCHTSATASAAKARELGLHDAEPIPRFVTATISVDFRRPTPTGATLELRSRVVSLEGRKAWIDTDVFADGQITVTGRTLMIMVEDD